MFLNPCASRFLLNSTGPRDNANRSGAFLCFLEPVSFRLRYSSTGGDLAGDVRRPSGRVFHGRGTTAPRPCSWVERPSLVADPFLLAFFLSFLIWNEAALDLAWRVVRGLRVCIGWRGVWTAWRGYAFTDTGGCVVSCGVRQDFWLASRVFRRAALESG
ncbi:hypothetical protein EV126DRAFT_207268 [Verticillium dahliae]|nr:hypothetical protein EV126DRAFT_207268 [Verticillium dahliae]